MGDLGFIEFVTGGTLWVKGDSQRAAEHFESSIRYCEETQNYTIWGVAWVFLGEQYRILGELETAKKYMEKGLKIYQDIGMPDLISHITYGHLGNVYIDEGNLETARGYLEKSLKGAQDHGARNWEAWWRIWLARTYNWAIDSEYTQAEASLLEAIEINNEMEPWSAVAHSELGALYADTGQTEKALANLKKAEGMMQEMGMDYWLRRTQEVLERVEAA
jgi:tetratricopeptide (TPR) repeat protein